MATLHNYIISAGGSTSSFSELYTMAMGFKLEAAEIPFGIPAYEVEVYRFKVAGEAILKSISPG